ncbi:GHMP family kinase ATP-binding protein [Kitasatospora azatica]|uniref:GHMP family kinase ATP-binding protein n=1 Tax=Kitasatospora azatica TaxID=58347 RepID=UPI00068A4FAE|nr:hypothetical protein [Kitasatospora azatica]
MPRSEADSGATVMARAPLRVSLAGGGTDLPSYARRYGGQVLSFAINRYVAVAVHPRHFDGTLRATWEQPERATRADELENPYARAALARTGLDGAMQLTSFSDVPSGTGLGSSAAFTVALLHALRHGEQPSPRELAEEAAAVEMTDLARPVGKHDHYVAAFGGLRLLHIDRRLAVTVEELPVSPALETYLREDLLLFHTGTSRDAGRILADQDRRTERDHSGTVDALRAIHTLVDRMREALRDDRVRDIGPILHEHWLHKSGLSTKVSSARIDRLYQLAVHAGADGGKVLGAGGGGFLLVSCRPGRAESVRRAMRRAGARELPFGTETDGSRTTALVPGSLRAGGDAASSDTT